MTNRTVSRKELKDCVHSESRQIDYSERILKLMCNRGRDSSKYEKIPFKEEILTI